MTPTNNEIYMAAITLLNNAALGYPVSYPGYNFTPPDDGAWLKVDFFPNTGLDNGLAYSDTVIPRGILQIECVARPNAGLENLQPVANQVRSVFAKGTAIAGQVRVTRQPYDMNLPPNEQYQPDRMKVVVSIEYSG